MAAVRGPGGVSPRRNPDGRVGAQQGFFVAFAFLEAPRTEHGARSVRRPGPQHRVQISTCLGLAASRTRSQQQASSASSGPSPWDRQTGPNAPRLSPPLPWTLPQARAQSWGWLAGGEPACVRRSIKRRRRAIDDDPLRTSTITFLPSSLLVLSAGYRPQSGQGTFL